MAYVANPYSMSAGSTQPAALPKIPLLAVNACNIVWTTLQQAIKSLSHAGLCKALLYNEYPSLSVQATLLVSRNFQVTDTAVARAIVHQVCERMLAVMEPAPRVVPVHPQQFYQAPVVLTPEQMKENQEKQAQAAEVPFRVRIEWTTHTP